MTGDSIWDAEDCQGPEGETGSVDAEMIQYMQLAAACAANGYGHTRIARFEVTASNELGTCDYAAGTLGSVCCYHTEQSSWGSRNAAWGITLGHFNTTVPNTSDTMDFGAYPVNSDVHWAGTPYTDIDDLFVCCRP